MLNSSVKARATRLVARAYRRNGKWDSAARWFLRAAELKKTDWALWFEAARAAEYAKESYVERAYAQAARLQGASSDCLYRYGRLLETSNRPEEALPCYERAELVGGAKGHLAFRQARCLERIEDWDNAAANFRRAAAEGFDPRQSYLELSRLQGTKAPRWVRLELAREGQPFFEPADPWTIGHARLAAWMNFDQEAVTLFSEVHQAKSLSNRDVLLYSASLESLGRYVESRQVLEKAVEALTTHEASLGPGVLFQQNGEWSKARDAYLTSFAEKPITAEIAYRIGLTFDREYRWVDAQAWFERAFRLAPAHAYCAYKLGHVLERQQEFGSAVLWYREAIGLDSTKKHWWYRLGVCLTELNSAEHAVPVLRRSLDAGELEESEIISELLDTVITGDEVSGNHSHLALATTWVEDAVRGGEWNVRDLPDLVSLAAHALESGNSEAAAELAKRVYVARSSLKSADRVRLANILDRLSKHGAAAEVLLTSRAVRTSDGVDLKKYLPDGPSRRTRLYAEFLANRSIDDAVVLFESNHGSSVGCHPLAIFKGMVSDERFTNKTFVWAANEPDSVPLDVRECPRVRFVRVGSDEYLHHLATASLLINNVSFPPYFVRREGQRYLNTWHGTPMKTLGRSMKQGLVEYENLERNFIQSTHILAPNELTRWALIDEHHLSGIYPGSVEILGSPRLDALVREGDHLRKVVRTRLGVREDERLVLVAPTWRGGVSSHELDEKSLVEALSELSGIPGVRVIYRAHRLTEKLIQGLDLPVEMVPADIDTNDLLAGVDHLVSDYSSIIFDFLVTQRPITLFVPDQESYSRDRGLYVMPEDFPAGIARTPSELRDEVESGGRIEASRYALAVAEYSAHEDGRATERCLDFILSDSMRGGELNHKPTVLFHGSLIPNGIASALLAILRELVAAGDVNVIVVVEPNVLRTASDRAEIFGRLPEGVKLVSRVGETLMTPEEYYVRGVVERGVCDPGADMLHRYERSWQMEARRLTGDIPISAAIEWDGYATLWAGILSHIGDDDTRRLIWQHNEMAEEQEHKYPELSALFAMYPWFDGVVSVSDLLAATNREYFEKLGLVAASGISSVPNSLAFSDIEEKSEHPLLPEHEFYFSGDGPIVLTVGRLSMEKNHEALIESWRIVLNSHPSAKLLILGSGPLYSSLAALISERNLSESVYLLGQVSNPYPLIKRADLFVLPSLHEGQPVVLFEAMSLGVPVSASKCPGNLEAMNLGYGATMMTDSVAIGERVATLLDDSVDACGNFDVRTYRNEAIRRFRGAVRLRVDVDQA